jgi:pimeloyl-ACP methyl ester carboxylesterase
MARDALARASSPGSSNPDYSTLTLEDMVEDVDQVVELIRFKYGADQVVLMGHSWGGFLGTAYLLEESHQQKISAWIEIDGIHNVILSRALSRQWTLDKANEFLEVGDVEYWKAAKQWLEEHPVIDTEEENQILADHAAMAGAYTPPGSSGESTDMNELSFYSPASGMQLLSTPPELRAHIQFNYHLMSLSPEMHRIRLPVLLAWGRLDGIVPIGCMDDARASLTHAPVVVTAVFEKSAHSPMADEKESFNEAVLDFLHRQVEGGAR